MSRIGRAPIAIPDGVNVTIDEAANVVTVKGAKDTLSRGFNKKIKFELDGNTLHVTRSDDEPETRALHGLSRSLVHNMVTGVTHGFSKELEIQGTGYRAAKQGTQLVMNIGYSHQVFVDEVPGITIEVPQPNKIIIKGQDKQQVGQFAANVRKKRPPEPYKGKGIRYVGEVVVLLEGKTGKK